MKRRFFSIILASAMVVTILGGCGNADTKTTENTTSEVTEKETENKEVEVEEVSEAVTEVSEAAEGVEGKNIGICIYKFDDNYMTLYREELERYLVAGGATVTVMDGKNDQAEQTNQIQNYITEDVDALIINLVQASAAEQIADQCAEADIPAVFINREPDEAEENRWKDDELAVTYVGAFGQQAGTYQGEIIAELSDKGDANGDGKVGYVMVVGEPDHVDAQLRTEYSIKALTDAGIEVEKIDEQNGNWDQAKGQEITANALTAYGDQVDVVLCNNDAMALGALQAIEGAGRTVGEDIYLVGVDALAEALLNVQEGTMTGTVFTDYISQAREASNIAGKMIAGETVDVVNMVDYVKVTKDNVKEISAIINQ